MSVYTCFSNLPHTDQHHCTVSLDVGEAFCKSTNICAAEAQQKHVVFRTKPTSNKKTDTAFFYPTIFSSPNQMSESSESNSLSDSGDGHIVVPGPEPVPSTFKSSTGGGSKGEKKNDLVVVRSRETRGTVQQDESLDEQDESSTSTNVGGVSLRHVHTIAQPTCADIVVDAMSAPTTRTVATINVEMLSTTNENTVPNVSKKKRIAYIYL